MLLLDVIVFICVGLALAMFGGGGAAILIPYLTLVKAVPMDPAVLLSLLTIGITTGIKTFGERESIDWKPVLIFSLLSFPTAAISGRYLAPITPESVRMIIFGAFTLTVALLMLYPINQKAFSKKNSVALGVSALMTGGICGLIGVGGGIFIAPTLSLFWSIPLKQAVTGSLAIVALQSVAALIGYFGRGVTVAPPELIKILVLIGLGMVLGKRLKAATSDKNLKSVFAVFLILVGIWVLVKKIMF